MSHIITALPATVAIPKTTLLGKFFPSFQRVSLLSFVMLALLGTALLTLSAKISIPFYPVPVTMQSFVVIALGCFYGSRLATLTVGLYFLEGLLGLPVFQSGGGLLYMMGPTGGFLLGFALAAYAVGYFFEKGFGRSMVSGFVLFFLGGLLFFIPGVLWISTLLGIEAAKAFFSVFIYGFSLKTILGTLMLFASSRYKNL